MSEKLTHGYVTKVGWEKRENGAPVFRAIVEYPNGPGEGLTWATVWDRHPVKIVEVATA
jgi:hypothetical protein